MKIQFSVFMSEIKIDLSLKKSNFLFLLCFKIAIIQIIPVRQLERQIMLPAYLLGIIFVATKNSLKLHLNKQISRNYRDFSVE